jgi:hypothetical protein
MIDAVAPLDAAKIAVSGRRATETPRRATETAIMAGCRYRATRIMRG